ncbi:MAG: deoxyribose-phosphate aldolase, partial [Pontimonas sp.]|nr:deoxyribose-phosphate aldolase [Pontimonas sp.]
MMTRVPVVHQTPRSQTILGGSPTEKALKRFLEGIPGVDTIGAEARAAGFNTRSLKTSSKEWGLNTIISMVDLTTLEGADTPGKVRTLAKKATIPDPFDLSA